MDDYFDDIARCEVRYNRAMQYISLSPDDEQPSEEEYQELLEWAWNESITTTTKFVPPADDEPQSAANDANCPSASAKKSAPNVPRDTAATTPISMKKEWPHADNF